MPVLAVPAAVVWLVAWVSSPATRFEPPTTPDWVWAIRDSFAAVVQNWGGDGAALAPGLVLGDTRALSESLDSAMRVASLSHLTAVSGANCAIVVAALYGTVALFGGALWLRLVVSASGLAVFVVIVGFEPSVIRASIMAVIALVAIASGRTVAGAVALSGTVIVALIAVPALSRSMGFALSVAATSGILVLSKPIAALLQRAMHPLLATAIAVPLAASVAVQPLLLVFAPVLSAYGIVANILVSPLVPIATVTGLIALTMAWVPILGLPFAWVSWLCASAIAAAARTIDALPGASIPWPAGPWGIALSVAVTALVAVAILRRRAVLAFAAASFVIVAVSSTVGGTFIRWLNAPSDWSWAQCDVGQGDAVLVRDSGVTALIDTGRNVAPLRECLEALGVSHIDLVILSHFDIDHVGAFAQVVGRTPVVIHGPLDGEKSTTIRDEFRRNGATVTEVCRGARGELGRLDWRVVWPTCSGGIEPGNPASVVVAFDRGSGCNSTCVTGVALGDIPAVQQRALLALGRLGTFDVVKVSHHGSRDQEAMTYSSVRAPIALIGVGAGNEYGHPTAETLALLGSSGSAVVRSDTSGTTLVSRDIDGVLSVWRERAG
jgi:competence protein ComEC